MDEIRTLLLDAVVHARPPLPSAATAATRPWLNVTSGIAGYPWRHFIFWDVLGEVLWVVLYVMLGYMFSDKVQYIAEILGNLAWAILALIVAVILGWKLIRYFRPAGSVTALTTAD